jgi:Tol biopolymer transport system component
MNVRARRVALFVVLGVALVPVVLISACFALAVGAGFLNARDDARDKAAADSDPRLQRPLTSTAGRVLFIAQRNCTDDYHLVNADGSGLMRLTHLRQGSLDSGLPIVSPDRTRLAVTTGGVLIVRLDRPGQSTQLDRPGGSLAWSPDGRQLASLSIDRTKRLHLFVFNADGTGDVRDLAREWPSTAAGDEQSVGDLVWSPDAKRFAFVLSTQPGYKRSGPHHDHVYVAPSDGSGLRNISLQPGGRPGGGGLAWSPDGRRLAFRDGRGIAIVDEDLHWTDIQIPTHGTRALQQPAWSPDGTRLAWFNPNSIVISGQDGGHQQELTKGRCRGIHPAWSDDGRRLAFVCYDSRDQGGIFVMNADGSGLTQITTLDEGTSPFAQTGLPKHPVWLPARLSPQDQ